jgi:RNA polymerase sigma-32 factor
MVKSTFKYGHDKMTEKKNNKNCKTNTAEVVEAKVVDSDIISSEQKVNKLPMILPKSDLTEANSKNLATSDPLTLYLREISKYKLLSKEQEQEMTRALYETGDIEIAKKLVIANLRLVVKISMEYKYAYSNVMDLIQEGNIGLMKAVSKYDPYKGAKLSYYASWWIKSYILKFILDNFRLVKIGTTNDQKKLFYNLVKEKDRLVSMGITPDSKAISESLGVSEKAVKVMEQRLSAGGAELSLDRPLSDKDGGFSLGDVLADDSTPSLDDKLGDLQSLDILNENLEVFLDGLKTRDREIFQKRLLSEIPSSLQSIADDYGVSRERIRQIEERLLKRLKVYMSDFFS